MGRQNDDMIWGVKRETDMYDRLFNNDGEVDPNVDVITAPTPFPILSGVNALEGGGINAM